MFRLRLVLAVVGLAVGQIGFWGGGIVITPFTVVFGALHLVPYPIYVAWAKTPVFSVLGGVALMAFPAVAYWDTHFDPNGFSFAYITVPLLNLSVVTGVVLVDLLVRAYQSSRNRKIGSRRE